MQTVKKGGIEYLNAIMLICLGGILLLYSISVKELKQYQINARDGLDSACLAAAVIDIKTYGEKKVLTINDYDGAWNNFISSLRANMRLDNNMKCHDGSIFDKINVHCFEIYNVDGKLLRTYRKNLDGTVELSKDNYDGDETTPDGTNIESVTIYADIGMELNGLFNKKSYVHVTSSVDVVKN